MSNFWERISNSTGRVGRAVAVGVVVLTAGGAAAWLASASTHSGAPESGEKKDTPAAPKVRRIGTDEVTVAAEVQASLGLKTAPAALVTRKRKLPAFQGRLNFDNNQYARVQSPFPGPIVELAQVPEPLISAAAQSPVAKVPRALKVGDKVTKGEVLAVVWSADLGSKKSDYLDAVSKLKTDEQTYQNYLADFQRGGLTFSERSVREAKRTVETDRIAVERTLSTLRTYRVPEDEIKALRDEADRLTTGDEKRTDPAKWARVEIKAPISGSVLEKSVAVGQVVDTTTDLFRIGDLSSLAVWVHLFDEDLPLLRGVTLPVPWVVSVPAQPGVTYSGRMEQVAAALDPTQQTALVTGTVLNPTGDLRAGMGVTVTVELPASGSDLEVPAEAVVEDGRESFVFVRPDPAKDVFVRRPVTVVRRTRDAMAIAERPNGVKAGDAVVTTGSLLLGEAFSDLPPPKP